MRSAAVTTVLVSGSDTRGLLSVRRVGLVDGHDSFHYPANLRGERPTTGRQVRLPLAGGVRGQETPVGGESHRGGEELSRQRLGPVQLALQQQLAPDGGGAIEQRVLVD